MEMASLDPSQWESDVEGNFPIHKAVISVMPPGTKVISAQSKGRSARAIVEGEYHSISAIDTLVPGFAPRPWGWGKYHDGESEVFFLLSDFHDMDFTRAPDPEELVAKIVAFHRDGKSPTGRFGFPIPTVCGRMERTVTWEDSWVKSFTHQLRDVIKYDNETNGHWPELDAACKQLIDVVIPRLIGALQSGGRQIEPTLIHGDLWENNVGVDKDTGDVIVFDAGSTYAHNEMEFGTWRCSWATYFRDPVYMDLYKSHIKPSEPQDEWEDRIRLYGIHPYLNDSAGHPGSSSRQIAYNDMLYLCEKYGPLDTLERYNPEHDISVTGSYVPFEMKQLE